MNPAANEFGAGTAVSLILFCGRQDDKLQAKARTVWSLGNQDILMVEILFDGGFRPIFKPDKHFRGIIRLALGLLGCPTS